MEELVVVEVLGVVVVALVCVVGSVEGTVVVGSSQVGNNSASDEGAPSPQPIRSHSPVIQTHFIAISTVNHSPPGRYGLVQVEARMLRRVVLGWMWISGASAQGVDGGVTVTTYNLGLAYGFVEHAEPRRDVLMAKLKGEEADVMCFQEVWRV